MIKHILKSKTFVLFVTLGLTVISCTEKKAEKALPYLGNYDLEYKLVDGKEVVDTIYPTIPFFYFRNQDSIIVKSTQLKGKVWIADFFFTTCSTICPGMTRKMKELNESTEDLKDHVQFISFSINPRFDKPSVLKRYIEHYKLNTDNWVFLTGDETETHRLGMENFMIAANSNADATDGFEHSEAFTLVDKKGYVRGVYNVGQEREFKRLEKDLRKLLKVEYGVDGSE